MPERILDLFTEFRARTNGVETPAGNSLLGALSYFGLDGMGAAEKEDMRALILRGGPWTEDERTAILDYCEADVEALERLLPAMLPKIDLPRALLRGRYMAAAAAMEHAGTPIDVAMLELFRRTGHTFRIASSPRSTPPTAFSRAALLRLSDLLAGWPPTTSRGRCSKVAISI